MNRFRLRERQEERQKETDSPEAVKFGVLRFERPNKVKTSPSPRRQPQSQPAPVQRTPRPQSTRSGAAPARRAAAHQQIEQTKQRLHQHETDQRFQHELREMEETHDLRDVDDDVEDVATLAQWHAVEHNHQPKSPAWFAVLAAGITVVSVGFLLTGNIIGAITIALAGGMVYYTAQHEPKVVRYRLMTEGVAFNNTLYHYRDLEAFNIVYQPGVVKTVILRSNRTFAPLLHMEIGDADPLAIRDILLEFVPEDQDLQEPLVDIYARRLGF